jgi:hypothetical protein
LIRAGRLGWRWVFAGVGYAATGLALTLGLWAGFAESNAAAAMAGALVALLPLQAGGMLLAHLQGRHLAVKLLGSAWALSAWLLLLTGERSAWLAVVVGAGAALVGGRVPGWARWLRLGAAVVGAVLLGGYGLLLVEPPALLAHAPLLGADLADRAVLWRQMIGLAADYRFTGSGLGMTSMVASSYLFLLHVPLYYHAHNTPIQIVLEQGSVGALGFAGMAAAAAWMACRLAGREERTLRVIGACGLAAVVATVAHALLDAELYASVWVPLFFLPLGYSWAGQAYAGRSTLSLLYGHGARRRRMTRRASAAAGVVVLAVGLWAALSGRAAWYANLGALAQTRAELSVFRWPAWGIQDQVRRAPAVRLEPAITYLRAALALDPANVTALRRLGQIALARGEVAAAHQYLLAAYAADPTDRAVRQLLGESYALAGEASDAVRLWQSIDVSRGQLGLRQFWYQSLGDADSQLRIQEAIRVYERGLAPP